MHIETHYPTVVRADQTSIDFSAACRAKNMFDIARMLFPEKAMQVEQNKVYPLEWYQLAVRELLPDEIPQSFANPVYILGEESRIKARTIDIDNRTGQHDTASGFNGLLVITRPDPGPRALVEIDFTRATADLPEDGFRGTIEVRHWNTLDRKSGAKGFGRLKVYSASRHDVRGIPTSDMSIHALVVTAGCYFPVNDTHGHHEYDGFAIVD